MDEHPKRHQRGVEALKEAGGDGEHGDVIEHEPGFAVPSVYWCWFVIGWF
jgi:hypothetical protein